MLFRSIFLFTMLGLSSVAEAEDIPFEFERVDQEQQYRELVEELRCLVCQNQTLADSHAPLAQDLRNEVYRMIMQGQQKQDIIDFLVARYGDFVLYNPPLKNTTLLLWFGPLVLFLLAALVAFLLVKNRVSAGLAELDGEQKDKIRKLLDRDDGEHT